MGLNGPAARLRALSWPVVRCWGVPLGWPRFKPLVSVFLWFCSILAPVRLPPFPMRPRSALPPASTVANPYADGGDEWFIASAPSAQVGFFLFNFLAVNPNVVRTAHVLVGSLAGSISTQTKGMDLDHTRDQLWCCWERTRVAFFFCCSIHRSRDFPSPLSFQTDDDACSSIFKTCRRA